ncbi:hypothetical protein Trydic_g7424 [Trypoxylus dichotomus]
MNKILIFLFAALLLIGIAISSPVPIDGLSEIAEAPMDPELQETELLTREKREARRSFSRFGAPVFVASVGK